MAKESYIKMLQRENAERIAALAAREAIIYVLINPVNNAIFYVGSTRISLTETLSRHLKTNKCSKEKRDIINQAKIKGLNIIIKEVNKCSANLQFETEIKWIHKLSKLHNLTNTIYDKKTQSLIFNKNYSNAKR